MSWPTTLPELLDRSADEFPERDALVATDRRVTYAELRDRANQFARGLLANGVRRGDRVGVLMSNRPEWFVANFAIQQIGATMVGLNMWYTADELEYALSTTDVSTIVTIDSFLDTDFADLLVDIAPEIATEGGEPTDSATFPYLRRVVVVGDVPEWALGWSEVLEQGGRISNRRLETAAETVTSEDDAYVLFSSGTTGRPKPIVLKHDGLATNPRSVGARMGITESDRFWLAVPLFFSFAACNASMTALAHGATLVLQERFDPEIALDRITEESCTVLYGMGNMYRQIEDVDRDVTMAFESVRVAMVICHVRSGNGWRPTASTTCSLATGSRRSVPSVQ